MFGALLCTVLIGIAGVVGYRAQRRIEDRLFATLLPQIQALALPRGDVRPVPLAPPVGVGTALHAMVHALRAAELRPIVSCLEGELRTHYFVGDDPHVLVRMHATRSAAHPAALTLHSATNDASWITLCWEGAVALPAPPAHVTQVVAPGLPIADLVAHHRDLVGDVVDLRTIRTADDVLDVVEASYTRLRAWRDAQPADILRERDVRALLGTRHQQLAPKLIARLAKELPDGGIIH